MSGFQNVFVWIVLFRALCFVSFVEYGQIQHCCWFGEKTCVVCCVVSGSEVVSSTESVWIGRRGCGVIAVF